MYHSFAFIFEFIASDRATSDKLEETNCPSLTKCVIKMLIRWLGECAIKSRGAQIPLDY